MTLDVLIKNDKHFITIKCVDCRKMVMIMIIIYDNHNHYHTNHLDKKISLKSMKISIRCVACGEGGNDCDYHANYFDQKG